MIVIVLKFVIGQMENVSHQLVHKFKVNKYAIKHQIVHGMM